MARTLERAAAAAQSPQRLHISLGDGHKAEDVWQGLHCGRQRYGFRYRQSVLRTRGGGARPWGSQQNLRRAQQALPTRQKFLGTTIACRRARNKAATKRPGVFSIHLPPTRCPSEELKGGYSMVRKFYHWKTVGLTSSSVYLCAGFGIPGGKKRGRPKAEASGTMRVTSAESLFRPRFNPPVAVTPKATAAVQRGHSARKPPPLHYTVRGQAPESTVLDPEEAAGLWKLSRMKC